MSVGWSGTVRQFLNTEQSYFLRALQHSIPDASDSQIRAWIDTYQSLVVLFRETPELNAYLLFEYQLLRGGGRRPDILLLANDQLLVIECKSYNQISDGECIQTSLYVRDLEHYHSAIQLKNISVSGILLLTNDVRDKLTINEEFNIYIATTNGLLKILKRLLIKQEFPVISIEDFLHGHYSPSPSMLEAASAIMKNEPLPRVRALDSSNFETIHCSLHHIIQQAEENNEHHLVLVTGEPGAGKTYLGLLLAHENEQAVYLSGNGPLVDVLQYSLQSDTFVQRLYNYKTDYLKHNRLPSEHIIIFDEAQRAWDKHKVNKSFSRSQTALPNMSEPDIIMEIATKEKRWSVTIGLVGEGQEIYSGEEGGIALWNHALKNKNVIVHCKHDAATFTNALQVIATESLHLDTSLRTHAANTYSQFVIQFIEGKIEHAARLLEDLDASRFHLRITRDLEKAKYVAHHLYSDDSKTVGVVCAGGADHQKKIPVLPRTEKYERQTKVAQYFMIPTSDYYCKTLSYSITEFQSQGLELDFAILEWDNDFYLQNGKWTGQHFQRSVIDPLQIKRNAYRVNLTRGRDGMIIYIPQKPELDETWRTLKGVLQVHEL